VNEQKHSLIFTHAIKNRMRKPNKVMISKNKTITFLIILATF